MSEQPEPDLRQIADDDQLLSLLASGGQPAFGAPAPDRALAELLGGWRAELDASAASLPPVDVRPLLETGSPNRRSLRRRRVLVAAAAGVVTVLGMTGTAAAISGPHGPLAPLHRVLFGAPRSSVDPFALQARSLLDRASGEISAAAASGSISDAGRASIGSALDAAANVLDRDPHAPKSLAQQEISLREALARIPPVPAAASPPAARVTPSPVPTDGRPPAPVAVRTAAPPDAAPPSSAPVPQPEPTGSGDGGAVTTRTQDGAAPTPSSPASASAGSDGSGDSSHNGGSDSSDGGS